MPKIPSAVLTLTLGIVITLISLWVGQHHGLLPEQASEQAPLVDNFFNVMVTIGTALFIVVEGAIFLFAIIFRQRPGDETDGSAIEGNVSLEIFWTAIPAIIVIGLGVYSVDVYERMGGLNTIGHPGMAHHHSAQTVAMADSLTGDPEPTQMATLPTYGLGANPDADNQADLTVNVLGMQYAWIFTYPDQGITTGELHVALGQDVQLNITAQDVIHSLWVPQFRMKQDAIPGAPAELRFKATKVGTYPIVCTELCGSYHGSMRSQVIVHSPEEYDQWLSENQIAQKDNPPTLAVNPAALSNEEFLAPYSDAIGVHAEHLHAMQH